MSFWYFPVVERKKKGKKMVQKLEMGYCPLSMRLGAGLGVAAGWALGWACWALGRASMGAGALGWALGAGLGVQARRQQALGRTDGRGARRARQARRAAGKARKRGGARGRPAGDRARQAGAGRARRTAWAHGARGLGVFGRACARRLGVLAGQLGQVGAQCTWLSSDSGFWTRFDSVFFPSH